MALTAAVPSLNPFLNLRDMCLKCLILPVPVVFLLIALTDQLYFLVLAAGYPQLEQTFFWLWKERLPHLGHRVCVLLWRLPKIGRGGG